MIGLLFAGCTRLELETKAEAYNTAIAESTNEMLLLNAVRASQRAPMSFIALGDVAASPNVSASTQGTFNFDPFGLTTYNINPSVSVAGGFTSFNMSNMNKDEFMAKMQKPVQTDLVRYFVTEGWPEELRELMFVGSYTVERSEYERLMVLARTKCAADQRPDGICAAIADSQRAMDEAGCRHQEVGATVKLLNTAREICGIAKFQKFVRTLRLLHLGEFGGPHYRATPRSAIGILYYLGELIAAQNYSLRSYTPTILIGTADGRHILVPLFEVRRGLAGPGQSAVRVHYHGDTFFIPQPELGTETEARSLQVLDFLSQVIAAQTTSKDIPKSSTIGLIVNR